MRLNKIYFFSLIFLFSFKSYSSDCQERVNILFEKIIESIGNKSIIEPELIFSDEESNPAYMSGESITIENKLINLFCQDDNFEDKISFVIAHELAHYYLQHGWMINTGLSYANTVGKSLKYKSFSAEEIKEVESQADIYAGFYGMISGYKTLDYAKETITKIYDVYKLPKELKKYPTFDERLKIIDDKIDQANNLNTIFSIATVLLKLNKFNASKEFYDAILSEKFNSREIYNNLGLSFLMYGVSISSTEISNLQYPIFIDFESRAKVKKSRSANLSDDPIKMFKNAKKYFERAIFFDQKYLPAKQNLFVSEILLANKSEEREQIIEKVKRSNLNQNIKSDFLVIHEILKGTKRKKIEKIAKSGSMVSQINLENGAIVESTLSDDDILEKIGIKQKVMSLGHGFGAPNPKQKIRLKNKNAVVELYEIDSNVIFKIGKNRYVVKSPKISIPSEILNENKSRFYESKEHIYFTVGE